MNSAKAVVQNNAPCSGGSEAPFHTVVPPSDAARETGKLRLAVVVSHPIPHFAPWHRELAAVPGIELKVFFCRDRGATTYFDEEFGTELKWDIPLLDGYEFEFLPHTETSLRSEFFQIDNPTVGEALARFNPDVVQLFGYASRTMWRARYWCSKNRVPVLLYSDSNASAHRPLWKRMAKDIVVRHFYRGVTGALFTGDNNRDYHREFGLPMERLFQGALPIDKKMLLANAGSLPEARRAIRKQYGIPEDAFVLVFSGKLYSRKSPMHLVEAVARCRDRGAQVWALMVGEGIDRAGLEEFVVAHSLQNVIFTGFVNQGSIGKYYASGDALACTSMFDPHPLVVPEAGCFGLPVIVSDRLGCIGQTDTAQPSVNAMVFPWSDIESLTGCILKLYGDRELYRAMSSAALRIADSQDVGVAASHLASAAQQLHDWYRDQQGCRG